MTRRRVTRLALGLLAVPLVVVAAGSGYYTARGDRLCGSCHEIAPQRDLWLGSSHRGVACGACHGGLTTVHPDFHLGNLRRLVAHLRGTLPDRPRIKDRDLPRLLDRCRGCHQQEHADWASGPHGVRYDALFLDPQHNSTRRLMDDCLRCHGMLFEGGIRDLVTPLDTRGPWRLVEVGREQRPAIPCLACHAVHRLGAPLAERTRAEQGAQSQELHRPSLAFYDRRGMRHVALETLPLPEMRQAGRLVRISPDRRQALCYQCHAALASHEARSGDDRTPLGVHEGLSCFACHAKHGQRSRASCAGCHPRLSNCGRDVETMDTTFRAKDSPHDIHFVACADCHPQGVPRRRVATNR